MLHRTKIDRKGCLSRLRWFFNNSSWSPTESEWLFCGQCIHEDERCRIGGKYFKEDAKASMAGRLMIGKAVSILTGLPRDKIGLKRNTKGKPIFNSSNRNTFSFNVSHSGDITVLAAEKFTDVGIDVMQVQHPAGIDTKKFLETMRRKLHPREWDVISNLRHVDQQLMMFYRIWCLKESYLKAVGIGIGFGLDRLAFEVESTLLEMDSVVTDTKLYIDGKSMDGWQFSETLLLKNHIVTVASKSTCGEVSLPTMNYDQLNFDDLVVDAVPIADKDEGFGKAFKTQVSRDRTKEVRPF